MAFSLEEVVSAIGASSPHSEFKLRFTNAADFLVPWLRESCGDLTEYRALEVGCGTGPKSFAVGSLFGEYVGIDLRHESIKSARWRAQQLNLRSLCFHHLEVKGLAKLLLEERFDFIVLYAVLEHLTVEERLETLKLCWAALPNHGYLLVGETPNRIAPVDYHSSRIPYFHHLPLGIAEHYIERSSNKAWIARLDGFDDVGCGLYRHGQHVGFHEFDIAVLPLAELARHIVSDGYSAHMLNMVPLRWFELRNLEDFAYFVHAPEFREHPVIPPAFSRYWLNFLLAKSPVSRGAGLSAPVTLPVIGQDPTGRDKFNNPLFSASSDEPLRLRVPAETSPGQLLLGVGPESCGVLTVKAGNQVLIAESIDELGEQACNRWESSKWISREVDDVPPGSVLTLALSAGGRATLLPVLAR